MKNRRLLARLNFKRNALELWDRLIAAVGRPSEIKEIRSFHWKKNSRNQ